MQVVRSCTMRTGRAGGKGAFLRRDLPLPLSSPPFWGLQTGCRGGRGPAAKVHQPVATRRWARGLRSPRSPGMAGFPKVRGGPPCSRQGSRGRQCWPGAIVWLFVPTDACRASMSCWWTAGAWRELKRWHLATQSGAMRVRGARQPALSAGAAPAAARGCARRHCSLLLLLAGDRPPCCCSDHSAKPGGGTGLLVQHHHCLRLRGAGALAAGRRARAGRRAL